MTIRYDDFVSDDSDAMEQQPDARVQKRLSSQQNSRRSGIYRNGVKRAIDVIVILLSAPFSVPLIALLALVIRRDGSPAFYVQERVGKEGRQFRLWKLRSMVADADERMADYLETNPEARMEWDNSQKLKHDPRITGFGRFLRRSSLDELPQLWNVLKGDMSLVGPRPMLPSQRELYPGVAYYGLRPGITGHWQTAGRNNTNFEARAVYDTIYDEELSPMTDLKIMRRTFAVVIKGTGY